MESRTSALRWRVVLLAAARLAGLYALGTAFLLLPFFLLFEGPPEAFRDLIEFATPIGFAFALAFILLAVARRVGFILLWLLLGALWAVMLRGSVMWHTDFATIFIAWSALAIPLALLGGLGVPATPSLRFARWKPGALTVSVVIWGALLIPALALAVFLSGPSVPAIAYRMAFGFGRFIWGPAVPVIVALSVAHIWAGTAPAKVQPPPA